MMPAGYPADEVVPELRAVLAAATAAVLQPPPGAGKTTRVPRAPLGEPWLDGGAAARLLGGAPIVSPEGRAHGVETRYLPRRLDGPILPPVGRTVIAGGRVPLTLHLLSPARRPVQVTQDLASFWRTT